MYNRLMPWTGLELNDVAAARGGRQVLCDVSCRLWAGSVTAVVGDNGAGKSTLIEVLAGVLPHTGSIVGVPPRIALVVQRVNASGRLPLTVRATVAMGLWPQRGLVGRLRAHDRQRIDRALASVGMGTCADRPLDTLSGGQRQRVLVAQGLVQNAPLVLLDEPTAAADDLSRDSIDAALRRLATGGRAVVLATHDRISLGRADHALLLHDGQVIAAGSPREVADVHAKRASAALALG